MYSFEAVKIIPLMISQSLPDWAGRVESLGV